jgi:Na+/H+-dicarboxylate symporter
MASSEMLRRVALVRTDVSEEISPFIIRVTRIGVLGTILAVTSNRSVRRLLVTAKIVPSSPILVTLMMVAIYSSETLVLTRATRRNIPEDAILYSHRGENHKSYIGHNFVVANFLGKAQ